MFRGLVSRTVSRPVYTSLRTTTPIHTPSLYTNIVATRPLASSIITQRRLFASESIPKSGNNRLDEKSEEEILQDLRQYDLFQKLPSNVQEEFIQSYDKFLQTNDLKTLAAKFSEVKPAVRADDPEDSLITKAKQNLAAGNAAEAYTLSADAGALGSSGLLEKYGFLSLVGSAVAIGVSKEVLLLSEEVLVLACFSSFISAVVVTQGQAVSQALDRDIAEIRHEQEKWYDVAIDTLQTNISSLERNIELMKTVDQLFDVYEANINKFVATRSLTLKKLYNELLLERLNTIQTAEQDIFNSYVQVACDASVQHVSNQVATDAKLRDGLLRSALDALDNLAGANKVVNNPLLPVFDKFLRDFAANIRAQRAEPITLSDEAHHKMVEDIKRARLAYAKRIENLVPIPKQDPKIEQAARQQMDSLPKLEKMPEDEEVPRQFHLKYV